MSFVLKKLINDSNFFYIKAWHLIFQSIESAMTVFGHLKGCPSPYSTDVSHIFQFLVIYFFSPEKNTSGKIRFIIFIVKSKNPENKYGQEINDSCKYAKCFQIQIQTH